MTYSDWREELSEAKVRLARALFKGLPAMIKNKPVRSFVSTPSISKGKKGVRGFLQSIKDYDGITKQVRKSTMQYNKPKAIITNTPINPVTNKPFKLLKSPRTGKTGRIQFKNFKGEYTDLPYKPYNPLDPNTFRPITSKSGSLKKASKSGLKKDLKKIDDADNLNLLQTGEADILKNMRKAQYQQQDKLNTKAAIDAVKEKYPFLKGNTKKPPKKKPKPDSYTDPYDGKEYDIPEEAVAAPTNSMGGGAIAGSVEAGDNPPAKKKKRYIYGGTGSRKMWMNNK